jgi:hypothetical protein
MVQLFLDNMLLANQNAKLTSPDQGFLVSRQPRPQGLLRTWRAKNEKTLVKAAKISTIHGHFSACAKANLPWR